MIKVVAFDLLNVLCHKNNIELDEIENNLKILIENSISDSDYLINARKYVTKDSILMYMTENLINKLYEVKDSLIFKKIKEKNPNIKLVIITNSITYVRNFVGESFDVNYLDDLIILSETPVINKKEDLYYYLSKKYNVDLKNILFVISKEKETMNEKINTLRVDNESDIYEMIEEYLNNKNT